MLNHYLLKQVGLGHAVDYGLKSSVDLSCSYVYLKFAVEMMESIPFDVLPDHYAAHHTTFSQMSKTTWLAFRY